MDRKCRCEELPDQKNVEFHGIYWSRKGQFVVMCNPWGRGEPRVFIQTESLWLISIANLGRWLCPRALLRANNSLCSTNVIKSHELFRSCIGFKEYSMAGCRLLFRLIYSVTGISCESFRRKSCSAPIRLLWIKRAGWIDDSMILIGSYTKEQKTKKQNTRSGMAALLGIECGTLHQVGMW